MEKVFVELEDEELVMKIASPEDFKGYFSRFARRNTLSLARSGIIFP